MYCSFFLYFNLEKKHSNALKHTHPKRRRVYMATTSSIASIVIVTGFVGSGKSTIGERLCLEDAAFKDEPDMVCIDSERIDAKFKLHPTEKSHYVTWLIVRSLMEGKTPVVCTSGDIFFNCVGNNESQNSPQTQPQFVLRKTIKSILGIDVKIIVLVPGNTIPDIEAIGGVSDIDDGIYDSIERTRDTVYLRVRKNIWKVPDHLKDSTTGGRFSGIENFVGHVHELSKKCQAYVYELLRQSNIAYQYPMITVENYNFQGYYKFRLVLNEIVKSKTTPTIAQLSEIRILTDISIDDADDADDTNNTDDAEYRGTIICPTTSGLSLADVKDFHQAGKKRTLNGTLYAVRCVEHPELVFKLVVPDAPTNDNFDDCDNQDNHYSQHIIITHDLLPHDLPQRGDNYYVTLFHYGNLLHNNLLHKVFLAINHNEKTVKINASDSLTDPTTSNSLTFNIDQPENSCVTVKYTGIAYGIADYNTTAQE